MRRYIKMVTGFGAAVSLIAIHEGIGVFIYRGCLEEPGLFEIRGDIITHRISESPTLEYLTSRDLCGELAKYGVGTLRRESNQSLELRVSGAVDTTFTASST